jgi:hypothetical protein
MGIPSLLNDSTELVVTGIKVYVKGLVMVWIMQHAVLSNQGLHDCRSFVVLRIPDKASFASKTCERCKMARVSRKHVLIERDCTNEQAKLFDILWRLHSENAINFLFPRFESFGGQPITKSIGFLNSTLTFEWINCETIVF